MAREHFDAVVVGSGFGGSVMTYRLAEAGKRVCLLERGKAYPPGSFPRTPRQMAANFWDPSEGGHGLFQAWSFRHMDSLVSAGLGGGSLIYANVLLRKDEKWFAQPGAGQPSAERWPVTREDLDPHYDRVEAMLEPRAVSDRAGAVRPNAQDGRVPGGGGASRPLVVPAPARRDVREPGPAASARRAHRRRCRRHHRQPPRAHALHLPPRRRVRRRVQLRREEQPGLHVPDQGCAPGGGHAHAQRGPLVGAARSRIRRALRGAPAGGRGAAHGHAIPARDVRHRRPAGPLGRRLRDDVPAAREPRVAATPEPDAGHALQRQRRPAGLRAPPRRRPRPRPDDRPGHHRRRARAGHRGRRRRPGFYVQEGGIPQLAGWAYEAADTPAALLRAVRFLLRRVPAGDRPRTAAGGEVSAFLGDARDSSGLMPLLGMGRDVPDGVMRVEDRWLRLDWSERSSQAYFQRVRAAMARIATALDAEFTVDPLWYLRKFVTVHGLGGCPMGRTDREGVVDATGQVFNYPGLYVADGSVIPGPVGPNPSLTIAALADRFADHVLGA